MFLIPSTKQLEEKLKEKYLGDVSHKFLAPFLNHAQFEDIEHAMQSIRDIKNFEASLGYDFVSGRGRFILPLGR